MPRDPRPLFDLAIMGGFLLLIVVAVGSLVVGPGRPTELLPADDAPVNPLDVPPRLKVSNLESALHSSAADLRVVQPAASAYCYICNADVDATTLESLPPREEYADCWRGVVLCAPDQPGLDSGPHVRRVGGLYLFGDLELMERVRQAADLPLTVRPAGLLPADDAPPAFAPCSQIDTACSNAILVTEDAGPDRPADPVVVTYDLTALSPAQAGCLDGKRARFRVIVSDPAMQVDDRDVYVVLLRGKPGGAAYLLADPVPDGLLTVEATLQVIRHPPHVDGSMAFVGFTEYRLRDAVRVGP